MPSDIEASIATMECRVNAEMNAMLLEEFTREEVDYDLFQMHPLKAPGFDVFSACFFQKHWKIVGAMVSRAVLNFLNSTVLDPEVNAIFIVPIPKTLPATKVTDFRPISLCNVLYKFIAKVLANRLRKVLSSVISH
ncbi:hypothetical protein SLA2020_444120 [Shorea laevis]